MAQIQRSLSRFVTIVLLLLVGIWVFQNPQILTNLEQVWLSISHFFALLCLGGVILFFALAIVAALTIFRI